MYAIRSYYEIVDLSEEDVRDTLVREIRLPGPERLWYVAECFRFGMTLDEVHEICAIDPVITSYSIHYTKLYD